MFIVSTLEILTSAIYLKLLVGQILPFYIKWRRGGIGVKNSQMLCFSSVAIWIRSVADGEQSFLFDLVRTVAGFHAFQSGRCEGLKQKKAAVCILLKILTKKGKITNQTKSQQKSPQGLSGQTIWTYSLLWKLGLEKKDAVLTLHTT